jgi:hypothetical protein
MTLLTTAQSRANALDLLDEIHEDATMLADVVEGREVTLGPALEGALFRGPAPRPLTIAALTEALAERMRELEAADREADIATRASALDDDRGEDFRHPIEAILRERELDRLRDEAEALDEIVFPRGAPQGSDGTVVLAALGEALRRAAHAMRRARAHRVSRTDLQRVVWIAGATATWCAIGARALDPLAGVLFDAMAQRWSDVEQALAAATGEDDPSAAHASGSPSRRH